MKTFLPLLIILATTLCTPAQLRDLALLDSLQKEVMLEKEDTVKIKLLVSIAGSYLYYDHEKGMHYATEALNISMKKNYGNGVALSKTIIGRIHWRRGKFDLALTYHMDALEYYRKTGNKQQTALLLTYIGQDYGDNGEFARAIEYWTEAKSIHEARNDQRGIAALLNLFSWAYGSMGNYTESIKYQYAELKIYEQLGDSLQLGLVNGNIAMHLVLQGKHSEALDYYRQALKALLQLGDSINLAAVFVDCATVYAQMNRFEQAFLMLDTALSIAHHINDTFVLATVFQGVGETHFSQKNYSDALENYLQSAAMFRSISNKDLLSFVYGQAARCYAYLRQFDSALYLFNNQLQLAEQLGTGLSLVRYYSGIQLLDSMQGNWADAFVHYQKFVAGNDSIFNSQAIQRQAQVRQTYEIEKKAAAAALAQEKIDISRRNVIRSFAAGMAGTLFFLFIVYRQRNKISREKKRSDELLLNILPEETAAELRETGSAATHSYEKVTVMFTDFKNFTQASEKMTADELVSEIHFLFSKFDQIISQYRIEKIKTIGDSYMCAGGLPVANETNAADVVQAAIEIQQFVSRLKSERENHGLTSFEMRIGIHTGPLIAGIVGIKKFAYDIWGDTVNIAAQMQKLGIEGTVNFTSSTYREIKDQFLCHHRGKIELKNLGDMDMYYIQPGEHLLHATEK